MVDKIDKKPMKTVIAKVTLFVISCLVLSFTLTHVAHSQNLLKDAVAIWLFDEDGGKKVNDFARNKHDGEFSGKPEWVPGKFGTALQFLGADEHSWIDIERPVKVDSVDLSIGCWLLPSNPQERFQNVLSGRDGEKSDAGIALLQYENTTNNYRIALGGVFNWQGLGNPRHTAKLTKDVWTHLVFVREGKNGIWYKDGVPDRPKRGGFHINVGSIQPVKPATKNFRIGAAAWEEGVRRYRGVLDEAFVYERALSQDEVQRIMNEGFQEAQNVQSNGKTAVVWGRIKSLR